MLIFKSSQVIKYYVLFAFLFVQTVETTMTNKSQNKTTNETDHVLALTLVNLHLCRSGVSFRDVPTTDPPDKSSTLQLGYCQGNNNHDTVSIVHGLHVCKKRVTIMPYGATPVKKYHSAVPHENSAFKNFACASLILYCEHISPI